MSRTTTSKQDILAVYMKFHGIKKRCRKPRFEMIRLGDAPTADAISDEMKTHWQDKAINEIKKSFKAINHDTFSLVFKRTTVEKYTNEDGTSWTCEKTMLMSRDELTENCTLVL